MTVGQVDDIEDRFHIPQLYLDGVGRKDFPRDVPHDDIIDIAFRK